MGMGTGLLTVGRSTMQAPAANAGAPWGSGEGQAPSRLGADVPEADLIALPHKFLRLRPRWSVGPRAAALRGYPRATLWLTSWQICFPSSPAGADHNASKPD